MRKKVWLPVVSMLLLTRPSWAADPEMMAALEGLKKQMVQMQRTISEQNLRIQQLESKKVLETPQPNESLKPPAPPQTQVSDKGAKFGGDFRLRMENFKFYDKNDEAGSTGTANDRERNRYRIRLRWGFEKDYGDDWKVGFRLATGNTTDQTSTNQTLGNAGYFNFKTINVDKAYAQYSPNGLKDHGLIKGVTVGGGKFENPFFRYSTPIVWDADVTPEGLYEKAVFELAGTGNNKLRVYGTLGQFIVNENAGEATDAELYGYQGALNWSTRSFNTEEPVDVTLALSYYDYVNYFRTVANNTASTSYLRTNSTALDDPRILDFYPEVVFYVNRRPLTLWVDRVDNVGSIDQTRIDLDSVHGQDTAWGLGFKYGKAKKKGDLEWFYGYYEIGANAVVAAFSDSDFGGPGQTGFTNRKGHKFGFAYQLTDNVMVNWTGYVVRPLTPTATVANSANESVFRSQADLSYKF